MAFTQFQRRFNVTDFLGSRSKYFLASFGLLLLALVFLLDNATGWEVSFAVFYLLPVSYFAWFFSAFWGVVASLASALGWLLINHLKRPTYSNPTIPYLNDLINLALFLTLVFIMSEVRTIYAREREHSRHDFLTGLANRRALYELLAAEQERALRHRLTTTLAYLDLDNFKEINDHFGHETGDELLILVANTIRKHVRNIDIVARVGGDEFCILFPQTTSDSSAIVLKKLQLLLIGEVEKRGWPVTFSIGAATFRRPPVGVDDMVKAADQLMYSAKNRRKGTIVCSDEG